MIAKARRVPLALRRILLRALTPGPSPTIVVRYRSRGRVCVVYFPAGSIDGRNSRLIGARLQRAPRPRTVVFELDLRNVTHLSPDGAMAFFTALKAARQRGIRLVITHAGDQPLRTLRQVGFLRALSGPALPPPSLPPNEE
ncbi:STAS domain-containing protein [Streptomyces sp. NPDC003952]